ncbi:MAG: hypothetical protein GY796_01950 [Chloroflexi bacterium]|nr:hypothetical protein [Chloroflexota bacterium]
MSTCASRQHQVLPLPLVSEPARPKYKTEPAIVPVAQEIGRTPSQVALNWMRQQPGVIIPIVGARKLSQLEDNLGALDFILTDEQIARLNGISQFELGFPHEFLSSDGVRDVVFGDAYSQIDNHR